MGYIEESCAMIAEEIRKGNTTLDFDIENDGRFLSLQYNRDINNDDNNLLANRIGTAIHAETSFYSNQLQPITRSIINTLKEYTTNTNISINPAAEYSINFIKIDDLASDIFNTKKFNIDYINEARLHNDFTDIPNPVYTTNLKTPESGLNRILDKILLESDRTEERVNEYFELASKPIDTNRRDFENFNKLVKAFLYIYGLCTEYPVFERLAGKVAIDILSLKGKIETYENDKVLVLGLNDKTLNVLQNVYNSLPESGDITEALLGLALHPEVNSNYRICTVPDIIANREKYEKSWNMFVASSNYVDPFTKQSQLRSAFEVAISKALDEMDENLFAYTNYSKEEKILLINDVIKYLKNIDIKEDLDTIIELTQTIVSEVIFCKTNYKEFIKECKILIKEANGKVDMADVIVLVNTKFIIKFLLGKIKVIKLDELNK